ncbi:MAG: ATP-dependent helicase, partial [Candidatus Phosphoribacter sp.]
MLTLRRPPALVVDAPSLDDSQRAALALQAPVARVLGGPGSGLSTLAVEFVVDRVTRVGLAPDECVLLAPTRAAAATLRQRVTARLGGTSTEPLARTHQAFGFSILRREAALRGDPAPLLLSGPEQDVVLRDLLAGHAESGGGPLWPEKLSAALGTRGFRAELRDLLMRAVEHGVDAKQLAHLGQVHGRPEWFAAAEVLDEYDQVTALSRPGAYDPAWILTAAAELLDDDPDALARLREQVRLVVVDDAQELTWAAARLLRTIAHPGLQVVLLGDPDRSVQTFRGADPRLLWWSLWPALADAPTVVLGTAYRTPAVLHAAAAEVARRIGATGGGAQRRTAPARDGGHVEVALLRSGAQEAAYVASALRRAHLRDGMPWREMAVVVRGRGRSGTLRRVLAASGVPVAAPAVELPVREEVAVRPLLGLLELSLRWAVDPSARLSPAEAADLCLSPLGGADAVGLRRLRRALRRQELDAGGRRSSDELLASAVGDAITSELSGPDGGPLRRITRAVVAGVGAARRAPDGHGWAAGVSAESVLWAIWSALGLADPW